MLSRSQQSGDTLVEVLLAFAILSVITVTSYAVMNLGVSKGQMALERSQVRTSIDSQAELVTYFRDEYMRALSNNADPTQSQASNQWAIIRNTYAKPNTGKAPSGIQECSATLTNSFYVTRSGSTYVVQGSPSVNPASAMPQAGAGLWIEPIPSTGLAPGAPAYVDLYIRACWDPIVGLNKQALSSVVRLYDR